MLWVLLCVVVLLVCDVALVFNHESVIVICAHYVILGLLMVGLLGVWFFLYLASMHEVSSGYAARQVVLSVLLTPVLFAGVVLIPLAVYSDLIKWRDLPADG